MPLRLDDLLKTLSEFPWKSTACTLRERFSEDRLGLTASSLTFTTIMALVPLVTVALAVFTAFPMFAKLQGGLQQWLVTSLIPDNISRQVLGYLTQFAGKASRLGVVGLALLLVTALALILTIDHTLNSIWRVRKRRHFGQRVLVYWSAMTLGPVVLGVSLSVTSYAISASRGIVGVMPDGVEILLEALQFGLLAGGLAAMYHYVPNAHVKWRHAWAGGLFVAAGIELAKKLLAAYLGMVPTYSVMYGAFATVPILLIWIYVAWVIVLLGAVMTAYLPSLLSGVRVRAKSQGLPFQLALETLQQLQAVRQAVDKGLTLEALAWRLRVDALQLEPILEVLCELDWVGRLDEEVKGQTARYVMLADPGTTRLEPLLNALLLTEDEAIRNFWISSRWPAILLAQAI
jgi:membrane protein